MWTCERCGEMHGDQFAECWKCAGAGRPLPPEQPPKAVRGPGVVGKGAVVGALLGLVLGPLLAATYSRAPGPSGQSNTLSGVVAGLCVGAAVGAVCGVLLWAFFPYQGGKG